MSGKNMEAKEVQDMMIMSPLKFIKALIAYLEEQKEKARGKDKNE